MDVKESMEKAAEAIGFGGETTSTPAPEPVTTTATEAPASGPENGAPKPAASARSRDESGRFTHKPADDSAADKSAEASKAGANGAAAAAPPAGEAKAGAAAPPTAAPAEAASPPPLRAPQSWRADEREEFAKAPRKVQEAALRREKEITTRLSEVAQTTRAAQEFHQIAAPYEAMFRSQGMNATQAFDAMARTYYTLQTAPPQTKAQVFAHLIQQAGLGTQDGIGMLAHALDGQPGHAAPQPQQPPVNPQTIVRDALSQLRSEFVQSQVDRAVETVKEKAEFWDDVGGDSAVRELAASLIAANRSKTADEAISKAYHLLVNDDPNLSSVMQQRKASEAARTAQASTARTQAAASSVRSTPAAAPARTAQPKSIEDAMRQAAEDIGFGR